MGFGSLLGSIALLGLARRPNKGEPVLAGYFLSALAIAGIGVSSSKPQLAHAEQEMHRTAMHRSAPIGPLQGLVANGRRLGPKDSRADRRARRSRGCAAGCPAQLESHCGRTPAGGGDRCSPLSRVSVPFARPDRARHPRAHQPAAVGFRSSTAPFRGPGAAVARQRPVPSGAHNCHSSKP
jgi:hypothetical protein